MTVFDHVFMSVCHVKGWWICLCLLAAQAKPACTLYYSVFLWGLLMVIQHKIPSLTHKSTHKLTGELMCWKCFCPGCWVYSLCNGYWIEWVAKGIRPFPLRTHIAALESPRVVVLGVKEYLKRRTHEQLLHWFPRTWRRNPGSVTWTHIRHDLALAHHSTFHLWLLSLSLMLSFSKSSNSFSSRNS